MKTRHKTRIQKSTVQRLVRIATRRWDSEESWAAIAELQRRGSPQVLQLAQNLCTSSRWRRRALGMYIVSQLFRRERGRPVEYAIEASHALLFAGLRDPHPEVIVAAVTGFAHRYHSDALNDLVRLSTHADDSVRWSVAFTLGRYSQPSSIDTLLRLMSDRDDGVRDYATWSIGEMHEADTPEIRAALRRNLDDSNEIVRSEALCGLANRNDPDLLPLLVPLLTPDCRVYELKAAAALADPALLDALLTLETQCSNTTKDESSYWLGELRGAIAACRPRPFRASPVSG